MKKDSLRETKKRIDTELASRNLQHDQNGRTIINMTVKDDSSFLSPFSEGGTPV